MVIYGVSVSFCAVQLRTKIIRQLSPRFRYYLLNNIYCLSLFRSILLLLPRITFLTMKPAINHNSFFSGLKYQVIVWGQILLQALLPLITVFPVHAAPATTAQETAVSMPYSQELSTLASSAASGTDGAKSAATGMATNAAASSVQQWLSQFGTARVQLNVDDNGNWDDSAVDLLAPLYDNKKAVLFTQLGLRAPDGRTTGNLGMGVRTFYLENWMFGGNVFFDDDFTGKNRRVGFGAEAWTNYLKLSANTYVGTTDWHSSRDFDDYNEKPADGYDIRAEGYLPAYPQLGAKLMYEQYYGDRVALFDTDHLQSNPSAVTTGISYTPVPLVQLAVDYKRGQDSMDDTQFQVNFRYDFGHDWRYQVDPENVKAERSLAGSRYDLVERNNQIVLQYKKKDEQGVSNLNLQVTVDNSPSDGLTPNTAQVQATDKDGQPVRNAAINWTTTGSAKFASATSLTNDSGVATVNFTDTVAEAVNITATSGAVSATKSGQFVASKVSKVAVSITRNNAIDDGQSPDHAVATVTDSKGNPVSNQKVSWHLNHGTLKNTGSTTDASGKVETDLVSTTAGGVIVVATAIADNVSGAARGYFTADPAGEVIDTLEIVKDNSAADGQTKNVARVTVKDSNGKAVSKAAVSLTADKSTVAFGAEHYQTNALGQVDVGFTDTVSENVTLTASLDNGNSKMASTRFLAARSSATLNNLQVVKDGAPAGGTSKQDKNVAEVYVMDGNNNPVKDMAVKWSTDKSTVTIPSESKTDINGRAVVAYTDTTAESVTLTASLGNGSSQHANSKFTADAASATISTLDVTPDSSVADGTTPKTGKVTVKDNGGNLVAHTTVTFNITKGAAVFDGNKTSATATTDGKGEASITFTDKTAETVTLSAKAGASDIGKTKDSTFIADNASAVVSTLDVTPASSEADGITPKTAKVTVKDSGGNLVANTAVTFNITKGAAQFSDGGQSATAITDNKGEASVAFTDKTIEIVTLQARTGKGDSGQTKDSTFVAPMIMTLTADKEGVLESGGDDTIKLTAKVVDSHGKPLSGQKVVWHSSEDIHGISSSVTTDAQGIATATVYSEAPHSGVMVSASTVDKQGRGVDSNEVTIAFYDVVVHVQNSQNSLHVGGASIIDVSLTRGRDTPITASHPIYFDITSGAGSLNGAGAHLAGYTDSQGKYSASLTSSVAGSVTVRVKYDSGSYYDDTITFTAP